MNENICILKAIPFHAHFKISVWFSCLWAESIWGTFFRKLPHVSEKSCTLYKVTIVIHIPGTVLVFVFFNVFEGSINSALHNCKPGKKKRLSTRVESEGQIVNVTFEGQQAT